MGKKKFWKSVWFYILIVILVGIVLLIINSSKPGEHDDFAKCLTEKEVKMYGTNWCHFCQQQKELFGKSFRHVDFINCDFNMEECLAAGAEGYPTWVINEEVYVGVQQLSELAELSGCNLN